MCGIMAASVLGDAVQPVMEGLSRLEYRGYDSAGISFLNESGELQITKKEGKLENLQIELAKNKNHAKRAIGHTRWATHGKVNDTNAHPHGNEFFSLVHNGIIENANELKKNELKNCHFQSETDSETFLHLVTLYYEQYKDTKKAIVSAFGKLKGNSSFVLIEKFSSKIYGIKKSAPLVCGKNDDNRDVFLSSDPYALVGFSDVIYFPEDGVLCVGEPYDHDNKRGGGFEFFDMDLKRTTMYQIQEKKISLDVISKGQFDHYMAKEIHEQPELILNLINHYSNPNNISTLEDLEKLQASAISIVACGTALHAGYLIKYYLEESHWVKVSADFASEFRYRRLMLKDDEVALFISQSGETADTLACQELCRAHGIKTVSIVNVEGSTLFRQCDANLLIHAGREIGVASTKAFTQQVLTGYLLSSLLQVNKLKRAERLQNIFQEMSLLSKRIASLLTREEEIQEIAKEISNFRGFIFTGRGKFYPIALEGALKLKEIAYVHAEGYAAGELKHGPISLFDESLINVAIIDPLLREKTISNAQEVRARKGILVVIADQEDLEARDIADYFVGLDFRDLNNLSPLLVNVVLQLLSYHIAKYKGTDIDKPRNLAKSVTVE